MAISAALHRANKILNILQDEFASLEQAKTSPAYGQKVLVSTIAQEPAGALGDFRPLTGWICLADARADSWGTLELKSGERLTGGAALVEAFGFDPVTAAKIDNAEPPFDGDPRRAICHELRQLLTFEQTTGDAK